MAKDEPQSKKGKRGQQQKPPVRVAAYDLLLAKDNALLCLTNRCPDALMPKETDPCHILAGYHFYCSRGGFRV